MTRHKTTPDDPEHNAPPEDGASDPAAAAAEHPAAGGVEAAPEEAPAPAGTELQAELADTKDRLLRALAETENLRRRSMRDLSSKASSPDSAGAPAAGRLVFKADAALGAGDHGVGRFVFADGRLANPIRAALNGQGTTVRNTLAATHQKFGR